ncbi:MAG TPA: lipid II flippase MurJ, partial [Candidatus Lustribacter sp.]|nr:lipid II flippase MurJ [Candidatus Lustribacter sp.]
MASGSVASRVLGLVRTLLLTAAIGLSFAGDAFAVANTLPNIIYLVIAGGVLNSVLVPQLVKAASDPDGGQEFTDRIITMAGAAILGLTIVATAAAPLLTRLFAGQFTAETLSLATAFAFICLPQILFYGLYALLGQVLNARG